MRRRVPDVTAGEVCWSVESPLSAGHATGVDKCQPIFLASIWPFAAIVVGVGGKGVWGEDRASREGVPAYAGMTWVGVGMVGVGMVGVGMVGVRMVWV